MSQSCEPESLKNETSPCNRSARERSSGDALATAVSIPHLMSRSKSFRSVVSRARTCPSIDALSMNMEEMERLRAAIRVAVAEWATILVQIDSMV